ncbi:sensor histidine kinase [Methanoplanus endosymbiosus]|uniref:histidine kinase n=1 Tax=Methanoplanus endosymbiosus TaxID=33865 RepID=A0A9E7PMT5_9EURY|nr:hybrid sensor histidine kinase/response regulator [Methanoplanus endosymbiosus]UUX93128.1 response regulator [Methanoplanus endosymbiosus]
MENISLLLVEDEDVVALPLEKTLQSMGYVITGRVKSGEDALKHLEDSYPDLIMMDIHLEGEMDGIEAAEEIISRYEIPVIYITADSDHDTLERVKRTAPFGYILKPFSPESLNLGIDIAIYRHRMEKELEEKNRELDAFTYSVSHDLRAPVRNISRYAELLLEDSGKREEKEDYIKRILFSTGKMDEMIDGFLTLSRVGRSELNPERISLDEISEGIVKNLKESNPDRNVRVSVEPGITYFGDKKLISIALENMINNAWKYTGKVADPEIDIGTVNHEGRILYIKDNGDGFSPEKSEDIFRPFKRLHSESDYPGTGIGLASTKKIIDRHGGKIWAESEPKKGTTIYMALP